MCVCVLQTLLYFEFNLCDVKGYYSNILAAQNITTSMSNPAGWMRSMCFERLASSHLGRSVVSLNKTLHPHRLVLVKPRNPSFADSR